MAPNMLLVREPESPCEPVPSTKIAVPILNNNDNNNSNSIYCTSTCKSHFRLFNQHQRLYLAASCLRSHTRKPSSYFHSLIRTRTQCPPEQELLVGVDDNMTVVHCNYEC
ncbi:unnamed protein product [Polarella glacialis]|uniref:Uncharacterized protein n=1 Tax=Polarella glacialis TaxID=89957 RepID=A0A813FMW1_POLGL|nr:unnamed protein product [Polarella glacialis]